MNEYGTADSFFYCLYYSSVKDNRPFIFSRSCLVFNVLVHTHVESNKFHQTAACHSVLLPQAFRRKLLEAKPYEIGVAGQIFYLLHGNWRAQSLDLRSLFSCFLLRATKHRLRSKLSKFFIQYFPCSSTCLLQFILWSIFRHFSTLRSNIRG